MKIISIVGARPQFIKLAPIAGRLRESRHAHVIIHTGQHYDYEMSTAFFDELEIPDPDINLEVGSGAHAWQTGEMLTRIGEALPQLSPDLVLVYGDTNSTLAGALASVKLHIPVGHIEAGYRSRDLSMPEEVNRVLTDRISNVLFAPTEDAVENLVAEGIGTDKIFFVGNIMAESLLTCLPRLKENSILQDMRLKPKSYGVLTVHRPENTDSRERLTNIINGILSADFPIVFPIHPRTSKLLETYGLSRKIASGKIKVVGPLKYLDFIKLQAEARLILTDSGGMQEEAILLGVPCLTLRYNTERTLTLELKTNKLVGADTDLIKKAILALISGRPQEGKFSRPRKWDTDVSARIIKCIDAQEEHFKIKPQVIELR